MSRFLLLLLFVITAGYLQANGPERRMRVIFYNVENLFDYRDDTLKNDNEFLPEATRHWTFRRYRQKLINLSKVLIAVGEGEIPAVIGLCEVENDSVMHDLSRLTPFSQLGYRYFITESPDERGINIALLYKRERFKPISRHDYRIDVPNGYRPTRDILHICGLIQSGDTLDLFVCHFPSRSGGENVTRKARRAANRRLRIATDSLFAHRARPHLLIMGDFNDYPADKLADTALPMLAPENHSAPDALYNLMSGLPKEKGSHKYDGEWGYLDQFIVSGLLLNPSQKPYVTNTAVFEAPFLLKEDTKYFGLRPLRTYYGYRYEGGYSDHLPIMLDILF